MFDSISLSLISVSITDSRFFEYVRDSFDKLTWPFRSQNGLRLSTSNGNDWILRRKARLEGHDFVQLVTSSAFWSQGFKRMKIANILAARSTFIVLQVLDLATTLVAFHYGAFEMNPVVGRLTATFGPTGGVLFSKVIAVVIAFRVRKLMWVANLFYLVVVCWNIFGLVAISHFIHR